MFLSNIVKKWGNFFSNRKRGLIFLLIIISASHVNLYAEIVKRIHKNGTIEYYSSDKEDIKPHKKLKFKSPYSNLIERMSIKEGIDPYLVKCVIKVESNFNPDAVSEAGAMGLMQIMQDIARYYDILDPLDPEENLKAGIKHLKFLVHYFHKDIPLALAAYHAGIGRVKKHMKIPPIKVTVKYVNKIMSLYRGKSEGKVEIRIKRLYKKINKEGIIEIYNR